MPVLSPAAPEEKKRSQNAINEEEWMGKVLQQKNEESLATAATAAASAPVADAPQPAEVSTEVRDIFGDLP